jgi:hypothetical protein
LESFRRYKAELSNAENFEEATNSVLRRIYDDNLFTEEQRAKLFILTQALAGDGKNSVYFQVYEFADSICSYLGEKEMLINPDDKTLRPLFSYPTFHRYQRIRNDLAGQLRKILNAEKISEETKRKAAIFHLEETVKELQFLYERTTRHYVLIKRAILNNVNP